jgi:thiol-disulfide isomerase/thioredoxin
MTTGLWVVLACLLLVVGFAVYRVRTDGRFHRRPGAEAGTPAAPTTASVLTGAGIDVPLGDRATLLQFSSAFCAPCRATRRVLGEVVDLVPGVTHLEVDAEQHLEVVRARHVLRTPTTLILDPDGHEVSRASGLPARDQVLAALARVS